VPFQVPLQPNNQRRRKDAFILQHLHRLRSMLKAISSQRCADEVLEANILCQIYFLKKEVMFWGLFHRSVGVDLGRFFSICSIILQAAQLHRLLHSFSQLVGSQTESVACTCHMDLRCTCKCYDPYRGMVLFGLKCSVIAMRCSA